MTSTAAGPRRNGAQRAPPRRCSRSTRPSSRPRSPPTSQRRGHRPQAVALGRRGGDRRDRLGREGADRRDRPDGVLRQLPASPADAARPARRDRRQPSQEALGRLSRIDEQTLVIGLSAGRPHPLITRTMKLARHRKAPTLAITDATLSEVARLARIRLYYSSNTPAFVRSHTALLSLIQALAYGVYSRDAQRTTSDQGVPAEVAQRGATSRAWIPPDPPALVVEHALRRPDASRRDRRLRIQTDPLAGRLPVDIERQVGVDEQGTGPTAGSR